MTGLDAVWWHQYGLDRRENYTSMRDINVGDAIAYDWAPYQVVDKRILPRKKWPPAWQEAEHKYWLDEGSVWAVTLRPLENVVRMDKRGDLRKAVHGRSFYRVLPEHYSVCSRCGDLQPCREEVQAAQAARAMKEMARFEIDGICPACGRAISSRQRSLTFSENLFVPAGPPVSYHVGRRECLPRARAYEKLWVEADPERRVASLPEPDDSGRWSDYNATP